MKHVEDVYVTDAYHSLAIAGCRVTPELINRVRTGDWNPEQNADDKERLNALAARGYWQAYQAVTGWLGPKSLGWQSFLFKARHLIALRIRCATSTALRALKRTQAQYSLGR